MTFAELVESASKVTFDEEAAKKLREEIRLINETYDRLERERRVTTAVLNQVCDL